MEFVDLRENIAFQDREGASFENFGIEISMSNYPITFSYSSDEAITSFHAINVNTNEIIDLSIDLIELDSLNELHICNGLTPFAENLECGYYYFLVNNYYQSDTFQVQTEFTDFPDTNLGINISGLEFVDIYLELPFDERLGASFMSFGMQFASYSTPLQFNYLSNEEITSFKAVLVDNLGKIVEEITLSTDLIYADGESHLCSGINDYSESLNCGVYYFMVNDHYKSAYFKVVNLEAFVCMELFSGETYQLFKGECYKLFQ